MMDKLENKFLLNNEHITPKHSNITGALVLNEEFLSSNLEIKNINGKIFSISPSKLLKNYHMKKLTHYFSDKYEADQKVDDFHINKKKFSVLMSQNGQNYKTNYESQNNLKYEISYILANMLQKVDLIMSLNYGRCCKYTCESFNGPSIAKYKIHKKDLSSIDCNMVKNTLSHKFILSIFVIIPDPYLIYHYFIKPYVNDKLPKNLEIIGEGAIINVMYLNDTIGKPKFEIDGIIGRSFFRRAQKRLQNQISLNNQHRIQLQQDNKLLMVNHYKRIKLKQHRRLLASSTVIVSNNNNNNNNVIIQNQQQRQQNNKNQPPSSLHMAAKTENLSQISHLFNYCNPQLPPLASKRAPGKLRGRHKKILYTVQEDTLIGSGIDDIASTSTASTFDSSKLAADDSNNNNNNNEADDNKRLTRLSKKIRIAQEILRSSGEAAHFSNYSSTTTTTNDEGGTGFDNFDEMRAEQDISLSASDATSRFILQQGIPEEAMVEMSKTYERTIENVIKKFCSPTPVVNTSKILPKISKRSPGQPNRGRPKLPKHIPTSPHNLFAGEIIDKIASLPIIINTPNTSSIVTSFTTVSNNNSADTYQHQVSSSTSLGSDLILPYRKTAKEEIPHFERVLDCIYINEDDKYGEKSAKKQSKRMVCSCSLDDLDLSKPLAQIKACDVECLNRILMIECTSRCPCGEYCTNKRFQKRQYTFVEPFMTIIKGWGLRALQDIEPETFIIEYVGEVIDTKEFLKRQKHYHKEERIHYYFMSLKHGQIIDATNKGSYSRFINHSCDPNCETQKWTVNGKLRIGIFAKKRIPRYSELTFDYKSQRYGREPQKCFCGSSNCRGYIDKSYLPTATVSPLQQNASSCTTTAAPSSLKRNPLFIEDPYLEEEITDLYSLCHLSESDDSYNERFASENPQKCGLQNSDDVIKFCRLMIRTEKCSLKSKLVKILKCSRTEVFNLFVNLQGLNLLWTWMVSIHDFTEANYYYLKEPSSNKEMMGEENEENTLLAFEIIDILYRLPMNDKETLEKSKIPRVLDKWANMPISVQNLQPQLARICAESHRILEIWRNIKDVYKIPKKRDSVGDSLDSKLNSPLPITAQHATMSTDSGAGGGYVPPPILISSTEPHPKSSIMMMDTQNIASNVNAATAAAAAYFNSPIPNFDARIRSQFMIPPPNPAGLNINLTPPPPRFGIPSLATPYGIIMKHPPYGISPHNIFDHGFIQPGPGPTNLLSRTSPSYAPAPSLAPSSSSRMGGDNINLAASSCSLEESFDRRHLLPLGTNTGLGLVEMLPPPFDHVETMGRGRYRDDRDHPYGQEYDRNEPRYDDRGSSLRRYASRDDVDCENTRRSHHHETYERDLREDNYDRYYGGTDYNATDSCSTTNNYSATSNSRHRSPSSSTTNHFNAARAQDPYYRDTTRHRKNYHHDEHHDNDFNPRYHHYQRDHRRGSSRIHENSPRRTKGSSTSVRHNHYRSRSKNSRSPSLYNNNNNNKNGCSSAHRRRRRQRDEVDDLCSDNSRHHERRNNSGGDHLNTVMREEEEDSRNRHHTTLTAVAASATARKEKNNYESSFTSCSSIPIPTLISPPPPSSSSKRIRKTRFQPMTHPVTKVIAPAAVTVISVSPLLTPKPKMVLNNHPAARSQEPLVATHGNNLILTNDEITNKNPHPYHHQYQHDHQPINFVSSFQSNVSPSIVVSPPPITNNSQFGAGGLGGGSVYSLVKLTPPPSVVQAKAAAAAAACDNATTTSPITNTTPLTPQLPPAAAHQFLSPPSNAMLPRLPTAAALSLTPQLPPPVHILRFPPHVPLHPQHHHLLFPPSLIHPPGLNYISPTPFGGLISPGVPVQTPHQTFHINTNPPPMPPPSQALSSTLAPPGGGSILNLTPAETNKHSNNDTNNTITTVVAHPKITSFLPPTNDATSNDKNTCKNSLHPQQSETTTKSDINVKGKVATITSRSTKLPPNWKMAIDATSGKPYYYHKQTKKVQWDPPPLQPENHCVTTKPLTVTLPIKSPDPSPTSSSNPPNDIVNGIVDGNAGNQHETNLKNDMNEQPSTSSTTSITIGTKSAPLPCEDSEMSIQKIKDKFRHELSGFVVQLLTPYLKKTCEIGRICNTEDFKYLARKLTHTIMGKELERHTSNPQTIRFSSKVKAKSELFIETYMEKFGPVYVKK